MLNELLDYFGLVLIPLISLLLGWLVVMLIVNLLVISYEITSLVCK